MIDEQLIIVDEVGAEGGAQEARPQLTLERHRGVIAVLVVEPVQLGVGEGVR